MDGIGTEHRRVIAPPLTVRREVRFAPQPWQFVVLALKRDLEVMPRRQLVVRETLGHSQIAFFELGSIVEIDAAIAVRHGGVVVAVRHHRFQLRREARNPIRRLRPATEERVEFGLHRSGVGVEALPDLVRRFGKVAWIRAQ